MIKKVRKLTDEFAKKEGPRPRIIIAKMGQGRASAIFGPSTKIPEAVFKIMVILNESL